MTPCYLDDRPADVRVRGIPLCSRCWRQWCGTAEPEPVRTGVEL